MFDVDLQDTNGNSVWWPNGLAVTPLRWGWQAVGGPRDAEVEVRGPSPALALLLGWLGYWVTIRDQYGTAVWWGYIDEIGVEAGGLEYGLTLDPMYNRVAVAYTYPDESGAQQRGTTDWSEHAESVARYGKKELLYSRSDLDGATAASNLAATLLAKLAAPAPLVTAGGGRGGGVARLRCRGWWETARWRYYKQLEGKESYEGFGAADQVVGVGHTSSLIVFDNQTERVYQVGNQHGFYAGDKVQISGSAANSGTKTIASAVRKDLLIYPANTISFALGDDILDSANGLGGISEGDMIQVVGSAANSGMWEVTDVIDAGHIEVAGNLNAAEAAGPSITINRTGFFTLEEAVAAEAAGPSVTVTAWGVQVGQSFSPEHDTDAWPVYEVKIRARKQGTPSDNLVLTLNSDSAGSPGTVVESVSVAAADVFTDYTWVTFTLSGLNNVAFGTTYWLVVSRSGSNHPDDYFEVAVDEDSDYSRGACKLWDGSQWRERPTAATMAFQVLGKQDTAQQVGRILDEACEQISTVVVQGNSGVVQYQYREGDDLAGDEIERLLEQGTSANERLIVEVTAGRDAYVLQRPGLGSEVYRLRVDGQVTDAYGLALLPGAPLAGKWVELDVPGLPDGLADAFVFYVESAEYDVSGARWSLVPENAPDPWQIATIQQG